MEDICGLTGVSEDVSLHDGSNTKSTSACSGGMFAADKSYLLVLSNTNSLKACSGGISPGGIRQLCIPAYDWEHIEDIQECVFRTLTHTVYTTNRQVLINTHLVSHAHGNLEVSITKPSNRLFQRRFDGFVMSKPRNRLSQRRFDGFVI